MSITEKANLKFLDEFARIYVDEFNKPFIVEEWEDDKTGVRNAIVKRLKIEFKQDEFTSDDSEALASLSLYYVMQRKEAVRREIGREARENEALIEMGAQIDELKHEFSNFKIQMNENNTVLKELRALISLLINTQTDIQAK